MARLDDRAWLVNSSLAAFKSSIECYSAWRSEARSIADDDDPRVIVLKHRLASIDPATLEDPASYWSEICEQVEHGLL